MDLLRTGDARSSHRPTTPTRSSGCTPACASSMSRRRTSRIESRRPSSSSRAATSRRSSPTRTGSCSPARCDGCDESIGDRGAAEQLLHGEPHPGNVLSTANGPLFIDLETCCRGPGRVRSRPCPRRRSASTTRTSIKRLLRDCRQLVLAMVAAWRWEPGDQFPNGMAFGRELLNVLRAGPPWPTIDEVFGRFDAPPGDGAKP